VVALSQMQVSHTLQQSRCTIRHILDQDLAPAVQHEAIQRRLVFVLGDGSPSLPSATSAPGEDLDCVSRRILEQEPGRKSSA
jgi:hypothetical protein